MMHMSTPTSPHGKIVQLQRKFKRARRSMMHMSTPTSPHGKIVQLQKEVQESH